MCHAVPARHERQACGCGSRGPHHRPWLEHHHYTPDSSGFGVRRPLRFLAWKLGLDEAQVAELAAILNELKTERAQHAVDDRRALTMLADAAVGDAFDAAKAEEATRLRNESAERVQLQVVASLRRMHELLRPEQRAQLAYLLRTGTLAM